jgi:hypothetical protein
MSGEMVFTVDGATATAAQAVGLAEVGLLERQHLQEWVIAHPEMLGEVVKIVAFEFGRWTAAGGSVERDRLDVLALDQEGHLIVVELKRGKAPDTVDMQSLKYAALVSRFTYDELARVHARYLSTRRGETVDAETAAAELAEWADITEETLRLPRIVLLASDFPKTVTATMVFLHQLGLDVRLLAFQAYRTASSEILMTISQHYPPPEVEEFVLSPEAQEARQKGAEAQTHRRETRAVARLLNAGAIEPGERLEFRARKDLQDRATSWLEENPARRYATWQEDRGRPLRWEADGQSYSPTGLAQHILTTGAGYSNKVQGPAYWVNTSGRTLVDLAANIPSPLA